MCACSGGEDGEGGGGKKGPVELPDYLKNLPEHQRRLHEAKLKGGGQAGDGSTSLDASEVHERDRKLFEKVGRDRSGPQAGREKGREGRRGGSGG